jgi:hypothetical protein
MRSRALSLVIALSLASAPMVFPLPAAIAQGMDADTKEAKTLFEDGVKLYKAAKYEEARVKFKAAYGLKKRPSIVLNLANAELQTKRHMDAIAHFKEVLSMSDAKPDDKDEAKQGLAEARKAVGVVMIDAPTGTIVTIDGESRSVPADGAIELMPGTHTVVVKTAGKDIVQKVDLTAGMTVEIKGKSDAPPVSTAPPVATTPPPVPTDTAPLPTASAAPTETAKPPPPPPPENKSSGGFISTIHPITWVALGVTVVGAIGWGAFYGTSQTHYANADRFAEAFQRPTCGTLESAGKACTSAANKTTYKEQGLSELEAGDSAKTMAIVSAVVTVVAATATVVTFVVMRKKDEPKVSLVGAPLFGGGGMFALVGHF